MDKKRKLWILATTKLLVVFVLFFIKFYLNIVKSCLFKPEWI